jgi:acetyltransferase
MTGLHHRFNDYEREKARCSLDGPPDRTAGIVAVGRLIKLMAPDGEFAFLSATAASSRARFEILKRLVDIGRDEGLTRIFGDILPENRDMLRVCDKLGFRRHFSAEEGVVRAEIEL